MFPLIYFNKVNNTSAVVCLNYQVCIIQYNPRSILRYSNYSTTLGSKSQPSDRPQI